MNCPSCGGENPAARKFCGECGRALLRQCPHCGAPNLPQQKFCGECGESLTEASPATLSNGTVPELLHGSPHAGERRQATVLFSDLFGYTAMNERLDPEEVRGIVGRIKAEAVRIVEGHGGIVNQFVGDEVLALFGIPAAHEDDPVRAVRAARDLHAMVRAMSPEVEGRIGAPLRLHTGISTGLIVTGTEDRRDGTYGITGDTVNTGARLASHAASDTVLVSEETQRGIADFFQTEPLEPVELKGKSARFTPYRVIEQTGVSSRFEAAEQRGFTLYAGREQELQALQTTLSKARAGQGQFVTVMGEPGIGKSRLLFEFRHGVPRDQVTVLTGRCQSYGTDTPYLPLVEALRRALRLEEAKGADALHDHAVAAVRAISPELERYLPQYLHLLSIPSEIHRLPATLQGDALRQAIEDALAVMITLNARRQPLVLILEDWHWADEASDSALKHMAGLIPHHPLQVVVSYRPEYERKWSNPENYMPLVLRPLGEAETAAMLRSVWKAKTLPDGLAAQVHARTGGNALFNEEVARGLAEDHKVRVEYGHATLADDLARLNLPDSVHSVIRARVDRLDPESREVLRLASVIGREFSRPLLERLHPAPQRIPGTLEILERQDLVHPLRMVPEPANLFKHALVQDVVYETLLLSQRKTLHEQVGAAIEALYPERLEEQYEALADHYSKSDNTEKAVEYLEKAGDKAAKYFSLAEARKQFRESLRLLDLGEMTEVKMRMRIALSLKWSGAAQYAPGEGQVVTLSRSLDYARKLEDAHLEAQVRYWIGRLSYMQGYHLHALPHFQHCLKYAEEQDDRRLLRQTYDMIGRTHTFLGKAREAIAFLQRGIPVARQEGDLVDVVYSIGMTCQNLAILGEFKEARALGEDAVELAQSIGDKTREAIAHLHLGQAFLQQGLWKELLDVSDRAMEISARTGDDYLYACGQVFVGYGNFLSGDRNRGIALIRDGVERAERVRANLAATFFNGILAECCASHGLYSEAELCAEKVITVHRDTGEELGLPLGYRALALVEASRNPMSLEVVSPHMRQSLAITERSGARPMHAVTCFRYAEILHKHVDLDQALQQLAEAERLFAEMEMPWWLDQAAGLRARWSSPNA